MYYTYILENDQGSIYIGQTNDAAARLIRHNANRVQSTKNHGPWKIVYKKEFASRKEAVNYESYLKSLKNPKYIKAVLLSRVP